MEAETFTKEETLQSFSSKESQGAGESVDDSNVVTGLDGKSNDDDRQKSHWNIDRMRVSGASETESTADVEMAECESQTEYTSSLSCASKQSASKKAVGSPSVQYSEDPEPAAVFDLSQSDVEMDSCEESSLPHVSSSSRKEEEVGRPVLPEASRSKSDLEDEVEIECVVTPEHRSSRMREESGVNLCSRIVTSEDRGVEFVKEIVDVEAAALSPHPPQPCINDSSSDPEVVVIASIGSSSSSSSAPRQAVHAV